MKKCFTTTQKHYFSALCLFSFSFISSFLFCFIQHEKDKNPKLFHLFSSASSNMKKTKTPNAQFLLETLFLTPRQLAKKYFRTPTHYLCFLDHQKDNKIGEKRRKTKSWTDFRRNLGQIFNSKKGKSWTNFQLSLSIYIYIYIFFSYLSIIYTYLFI